MSDSRRKVEADQAITEAAAVAIQCAVLWLLWTLGYSWSRAKRSGVPV